MTYSQTSICIIQAFLTYNIQMVTPHLNYSDIIYMIKFSANLSKIRSNQFSITQHQPYQWSKMFLQTETRPRTRFRNSLQQRLWYRRLLFFLILKSHSPNYLCKIIPKPLRSYRTSLSKKLQLPVRSMTISKIHFPPRQLLSGTSQSSK